MMFSARGAGILGLSTFGRDHFYVLDENMEIDIDGLQQFCTRHHGSPILLFGFTFMVWEYFIKALRKAGQQVELDQGVLIHSGGWKKLAERAVDNATFKQALVETCGIRRVHNFYGMVEQTGSVFMECEHGRLHTSIFGDVIVRDAQTWLPLPQGSEGLLEVLSVLPGSYPGHALLTEDVGSIIGEDDCPCGRLGKTISVRGRIAKAELRGCSDTYAASH
jgi:hypothetical protein